MKYEIQEQLYSLAKNNGEILKVNKIKWLYSSKYDLRIWKDNIPMQGIVLSGKELQDFCKSMLLNEGIEAIGNTDSDDFQTTKTMSDIDLKEMIDRHPECLVNLSKFKAMCKDYFPGRNREINVLCSLYECGISTMIRNADEITTSDIQKYLNIVENEFGIKKACTLWGIEQWADAYNIYCDISKIQKFLETNTSTNNTPIHQNISTNSSTSLKGNIYSIDDDILIDSGLQITYKGLFCPYRKGSSCFNLNFPIYAKNSTGYDVEFFLYDIEINDYQIRIYNKVNLQNGKQIINKDQSTSASDLEALGIKSFNDIKTLKAKLCYKINGITKQKEIFLEPKGEYDG